MALKVILILSNKWDLTVDLVVLELQRRGADFIRLNTEDLSEWSVVAEFPHESIYLNSIRGDRVKASEISSIWYRRPGQPFDDVEPSSRPSTGIQKFIADQWYTWIESFQLAPQIRWLNHPHANGLMENKIRQLSLARKIGFTIPNTLITNDAKKVISWMEKIDGGIICKALYSPLIEEPESDKFIFANRVESLPDDFSKSLSLAPVIFQQAIEPKIDYRVTVVGSKVLAAKIYASTDNIDWRTAKEGAEFIQCELPLAINTMCLEYVAAAGLQFGAIDLLEKDGHYYFLEINPNGEWGWLERPHNIPISSAISDFLTGKP